MTIEDPRVFVLDHVVNGEVVEKRVFDYVLENQEQVAGAIQEIAPYIKVGDALVVRPTTRFEETKEILEEIRAKRN